MNFVNFYDLNVFSQVLDWCRFEKRLIKDENESIETNVLSNVDVSNSQKEKIDYCCWDDCDHDDEDIINLINDKLINDQKRRVFRDCFFATIILRFSLTFVLSMIVSIVSFSFIVSIFVFVDRFELNLEMKMLFSTFFFDVKIFVAMCVKLSHFHFWSDHSEHDYDIHVYLDEILDDILKLLHDEI
jgi:hypothetical protein